MGKSSSRINKYSLFKSFYLMILTQFLLLLLAICAVARPWESLIIGFIGGMIACAGCTLLLKLRIDDPVGCVPTHFFASVWGMVAVGLFVEKDSLENLSEYYGVFKGGSWRMLGVQILAVVAVSLWAATITVILLFLVNLIIKLRMPLEMELEGADKWEHGIGEEDDMPEVQDTNGIENPAVDVSNGEAVSGEDKENIDKKQHVLSENTDNQLPSSEKLEKSKRRLKYNTWKKRIKTRSHSVDIDSEGIRNGEESHDENRRRILSFGELQKSSR